MKMEKREHYYSPSTRVIEIKSLGIICTSTDTLGISSDAGYTEEEW